MRPGPSFVRSYEPPGLQPLPCFLPRQVVVQAKEIKEIPGPLPCVAIPMRVPASKDLEARTLIPTHMMLLEGTGPHPTPIQLHIAPNHLNNILRLAPRPNRPMTARWSTHQGGRGRNLHPLRRHTDPPISRLLSYLDPRGNLHPLHRGRSPGETLRNRVAHRHQLPISTSNQERIPPPRLSMDAQGETNERSKSTAQSVLFPIQLQPKRHRKGQ